MKNQYPKVVFKIDKQKDKQYIINELSHGKLTNQFRKDLGIMHPKLMKGIEESEDKSKIISDYVDSFYENHSNEMKDNVKRFQKSWDKINDNVMKALIEITDCVLDKKQVNAIISMTPNCPRFLDSKEFFITIDTNIMKKIAVHELTHFYFFEKWKKVFPKDNQRKFEQPYLIWHFSEIAVDPIANDKRFAKFWKTEKGHITHEHYYKMFVKPGVNVVEYFQKIYDEEKGNDFEEFLKKGRKEVYKLRKKFIKNNIMARANTRRV